MILINASSAILETTLDNSLAPQVSRSTATPSRCYRNSCKENYIQRVCCYCNLLHSQHKSQPNIWKLFGKFLQTELRSALTDLTRDTMKCCRGLEWTAGFLRSTSDKHNEILWNEVKAGRCVNSHHCSHHSSSCLYRIQMKKFLTHK